ncbi:MAG: nucleoside recognition domain-containing protein [Paludibacter sp.]|nr:nucleoside recognition domain-containing protein [Paludibacter sp.]
MNLQNNRFINSIVSALPIAGKTIVWLLKIIIPVSLAVSLLQYWGVIAVIADFLSPAFSVIGLPGESAIVFISSIFLSLYAPIAIIATLGLDMREITILALMCLISHNMIVETAIQKKTGSSAIIMFVLRIVTSFVSAYILHLLLPRETVSHVIIEETVLFSNLFEMLIFWVKSAGWLIFKITIIVSGLMILQNMLKEYNLLNQISKIFLPFMKVFGLSPDSSFLWFVSQTLGLTYGSAVMIESVEKKEISRENANLLNYHIAINHSMLEDTLLFVAIGVSAGWIMLPRLIIAFVIVWIVRLILHYKKK